MFHLAAGAYALFRIIKDCAKSMNSKSLKLVNNESNHIITEVTEPTEPTEPTTHQLSLQTSPTYHCETENKSNNSKSNESTMNPKKHAKSTLNPNATPFIPAVPARNKSNNQRERPTVCRMMSIEEEKETDIDEWKTKGLYPKEEILKSRFVIFISDTITKNALESDIFDEYFETATDLFYYLRWQCRMQVMDGLYRIFISCSSKQEMVTFNTELHDKCTKAILFVVGQQNDAEKQHSQKWKMTQFMTATQIYKVYNIKDICLPSISKLRSKWNIKNINECLLEYKMQIKNRLNMSKIKETIQISKNKSNKSVCITSYKLVECVMSSMQSKDKRHALIPIIWFDKHSYSIQMLLPIHLGSNNWIGITFKYDNDAQKQLYPVRICVDCIDIHRKLAFFKPLRKGNEYHWLSNNITALNITCCDEQQKIRSVQQRHAKEN